MADVYISAPIETDPEALKEQVFEELANRIEGWEPSDGQLDVWLIEAFCEIAAQLNETASFVVRAIFRYYGQHVLGLPPKDAVPAIGIAELAMIDDAGYIVPAGTVFGFSVAEDFIAFETTQDAVVPVGETQVEVRIAALEGGTAGNELSGLAEPVDTLDYLALVTVDTPTDGGVDAEDEEAYFDRLVGEMKLLSPRAIRASDMELLARRVPEVDVAVAFDNYDPGPPADDEAEGAVHVVARAADGGPLSANGIAELNALLNGDDRLLNLQVTIGDADYHGIDVTYTAKALPGWDPDAVKTAIDEALAQFLNPATWGLPPGGEVRRWINEPKVRFLKVAQAIQEVDGVRYLDSLTIGFAEDTQGTSDLTMSGIAPLPEVGAIDGTVS